MSTAEDGTGTGDDSSQGLPTRTSPEPTKKRDRAEPDGLTRRRFIQGSTGVIAIGALGAVPVAAAAHSRPHQTPLPDTVVTVSTTQSVSASSGSGAAVQLIRNGSFEEGGDLSAYHDWVVRLTGTPTGGTFFLSVRRKTGKEKTSPIPYDASAQQVLSALTALDSLADARTTVTEHLGMWLVSFDTRRDIPKINANGRGLTGSGGPDARTDLLSRWDETDGAIAIVDHGSHGKQSALIVASQTSTRVWRGQLVPCTPGQVLSIGADSRSKEGDAQWQIGLRYFRADLSLITTEYNQPAHTGSNWQRRTGTAVPAPAQTAWAGFTVTRPAAGAAAGDQLELDAVLVATGQYTGPILPAIIMSGAIEPDGFLLSAYAGHGSDQIRARIYQGGDEVDQSPTTPGSVAAHGWGFTRATGLDPMTRFEVQLESRNRQTQTWESFGELI